MVTREDLHKYCELTNELDAKDLWIETLYNTYKSPQMTGDGSSHSSDPGNPVWYACQRIEKAKEARDELRKKIREIEEFVESIEDTRERTICTLHYLAGFNWEATCRQMRGHGSSSMLIEYDRIWWKNYEDSRTEQNETA